MFDNLLKYNVEFFSMPELPEVETTRLALCEILLKEKINLVKVINSKLRYKVTSDFSPKVKKKIVLKIERKGKFLIFFLSQKLAFIAHLGMTGVFRVEKKYKPQKHDHIMFKVEKYFVIYNDVRKFGFFKLYSQERIYQSPHLKHLGIEPLTRELETSFLVKLINKKSVDIKSFLMNQRFIAGLGNIYCSEVLFSAGISPLRICNEVSHIEAKKIVLSIKKVLRRAIKNGGTSLQNFQDPNGKIGYFSNYLKVYNRKGKICLRCKKNARILKLIIQNRSTFYCKKCQK